MADRIKFHPSTGSGHRLDEHVDPDIARALRRYGIDVTTTVDAGLRTEDDPVHLDFIRSEGRMVVTHDADFLRYASRSSDHLPTSFSMTPSTCPRPETGIDSFQAIAEHVLQEVTP